jgi:hypothetical protein
MSGGESFINNGILNDRAIINQCKLAGTSNNAGMSNTGTNVNPPPPIIFNAGGESHIHIGSLKARSQIDKPKHPAMPTDAGMLTDGIEPLPLPEPPPLIFTPEKLIRHTFLMEKQEDGQKLRRQIVVCNVKMEWENGEITNKPLRVIADYFVHITQYVYRHKPDCTVTLSTLMSQLSVMDLLPIDDNVFGIQEGCKVFIEQA